MTEPAGGSDEPDLVWATIGELAPRLAAGTLSPVALCEALLARIARLDSRFNAFVTVDADAALAAARRAEAEIAAGYWRGPLHGMPIAVKDLFATRGVRTTAGSRLFETWVPDFDAAVVERLHAAGAVMIGKTGMHELAYGSTSINPYFGAIRNPWNTDCHPGGSSGGSAVALSAGMVPGALGSDTGCSIRQPAAVCGVVGLKPTFGRVSKFGAVPLAWSLDHVGPMTRSVADAALLLQALAGFDPRDPCTVERPVPDYSAALDGGVRGLRLGLVRSYFFDDCHPEIAQAVLRAATVLRDLGATIDDIELPDMAAAQSVGVLSILVEAATVHAEHRRTRPQAISPELHPILEVGAAVPASDYLQAQRLRRQIATAVVGALERLDGIVTPTTPVPATPIEATPAAHATLRYRCTIPFNLTGLPAISVPCGFTTSGLPIGLQIVGRPFDEAGILRIAHAFERATEWHDHRPPICQ